MTQQPAPERLLIKVCCIQDEAELFAAAKAGATHVGLVGEMPSGPGPISEGAIRRIAVRANAITTVLLTSRVEADDIVDHVRSTGVDAVQIVTPVGSAVRAFVRTALPNVGIIQVVHVEGPESIDGADVAGADYLLLDSGQPSNATPVLGGTGQTHDWELSRAIIQRARVPVFLAGGLTPDNVGQAIRTVGPAGVDACSGLRDEAGRLDSELLDRFVRAVRTP